MIPLWRLDIINLHLIKPEDNDTYVLHSHGLNKINDKASYY